MDLKEKFDDFNESDLDHQTSVSIMLNRIAKSSVIVKSQQKDEPDLCFDDRLVLIKDIYEKSKTNFVLKFGRFLLLEELCMLEEDNNSELKLCLKNLKCMVDKTQIKNRRYIYMKDILMKDGFFNDAELQQRNPLLYKHYVENYKIRNISDQQSFSSFLFEKMDNDWYNFRCDVESKIYENAEEEEENSDDDLNIELKKYIEDGSLVSDKEKSQMQQEFFSFMENRFLSGEDDFDYSNVDLNVMHCDSIGDQDLEDQYFDAEDPD
uniref:Coiled-coil domain-containing protein 97 n=1 Tax=Hydra vulgaris TaxID=6087 RepID=T2M777_HYDVU